MKRSIDSIKENEAVHCPTKEQSIEFCRLLHNAGESWRFGATYLSNTMWDSHRENTCYNVRNASYSDLEYYKNNRYKITNVSEFLSDKEEIVDKNVDRTIKLSELEFNLIIRTLGMAENYFSKKRLDYINEAITVRGIGNNDRDKLIENETKHLSEIESEIHNLTYSLTKGEKDA